MKGKVFKTGLFCVALFLSFVAVTPAKAFYLEIPQVLKNLIAALSSNKSSAQEEGSYIAPSQPASQTCNVNGVEMPGSCDKYNQSPMPPQQTQQYMGPSPEDQQRQEQEQLKQQQRQMEDMKRNAKQMERQVKEFQRMLDKAQKDGLTIPDEIKQNLEKLKSIIDSVKNATTMEEMQNIDMGEMGNLMQSLEEFRRNVVEANQRMQEMKRNVKNMESGLKMFERQVAALAKKKITIPADVQDNINKVKAIINGIKNAKTWDEMEQLDLESMGDMMNDLNESRQQMEMLARWPQTLKQVNSEITRLERQLKRDKTVVDRLLKKGIDLQGFYVSFQEAINKLKAVRDDAVAKIAAGESQDAFEAIQNDFFSQMEDVWQNDKIIQTMNNLGRFNSEFKQGINQAQQMIKNLKRKKLDTSALESSLAEAKTKGQEVLNMLKSKEIDEESIMAALDELENLRQEFDQSVSELTGQGEDRPWEQGPNQFKSVEMPKSLQQYIPQKVEQQPTQTSPVVEPQPAVESLPTVAP